MIRQYNLTDFEQLSAIYDAAKPEEFRREKIPIEVPSLSNDPKMISLFEQSNIYVFEDNSIKGFSGTKGNELTWLFVHPDSWGQEIAKRLVIHAISSLDGIVTLNVARSNHRAIKLYQRLGFKIDKQYTGHYAEQPIEVATMSIKLKNCVRIID